MACMSKVSPAFLYLDDIRPDTDEGLMRIGVASREDLEFKECVFKIWKTNKPKAYVFGMYN